MNIKKNSMFWTGFLGIMGIVTVAAGLIYAGFLKGNTVKMAKKTRSEPSLTGQRTHVVVVTFDFAKADLKIGKAMEAKCAQVAQELKNYPYAKLEIDGHTDVIGPDAVNQKLSEERALALRQHFIERYGISPDRIVMRTFGKNRPEVSNNTPQGRHENRRAVVTVYRLEPYHVASDAHNL